MGTDKIRKYLIPNIPYLFILWAFLKLGTAYRLAAGNDFAHKLIGLGQTIGPAFADFAPGLVPLDWLVGIVGAVGFRLLIYFKSKNTKKFRRDAEYGSARWGTEKDIKPFVDPRFENNVILTGTEFLTMNTRPKIPANARNLNCCIIGSSGSGKTRFWLTPQLLQAHSSYVVVDPKGGVLGQVGGFLQKRGYKIKVFNSIDFSKSMHYNPLAYIRNEADILKFVDALISNTKGEGKEGDPFWTKSETLLYCALIAYIIFEGPAEDRNMNTLVDIYDGLQKIKFEKPRAKYKAEHEAELKQFYAARRKLTGEFPDGKVDMKKLSDEYDELEQAHNTTYGEFKTVRDDLHRLWKVKSCVDTAARFNERTEEQKLQNRPQTRQKKEELSR